MEQKLILMADQTHVLSSSRASSLKDWLSTLREFELDNIFETRILGRGYEYIQQIEMGENHADKLEAKIQGQKEYKLKLSLLEEKIIGQCSCPYTPPCKHLAALLLKAISQYP